jgi:dTDP-glucose 4,6-dehydratase
MNSPPRSLLVTGGAGFIGANFVHHWHRWHPSERIVVLDALTYAGNRMSLASLEASADLVFVQGDIVDTGLVESTLREHGIDTVVHFAAESHVDRSIVGPDAFIETNVVGTHSLLKACRKLWLQKGLAAQHRFHHISTDEVFGSLGPQDPPFREDTPYAPNSPYAASKAASDHLVRAYAHTFGLQVTTTNCSNNYGPFHFPEKLIPLVIVNLLEGKPLPIYGDGRNVRDWLFVADHCRAIELVLDRGRAGETYNVGGRAERTNLELVRALCAIADAAFAADASLAGRFPKCPSGQGRPADSLISFVADRPGHDRRYAIDAAKIEGELGFSPGVTLEDGLAQTFRWYLNHEPWWRSVMDGSYRGWIDQQYGETKESATRLARSRSG